jgi:alkanesulfonate monooxygenase SsuD/methylene tetrahydromethanopterin reductase-like flavin-dependent oxidoreductase (luciferase family)
VIALALLCVKVVLQNSREYRCAWSVDRLGFDGVGFNEHHCSPYWLLNSPNRMAAAAAQRTSRLKLLIYGDLLPLHQPAAR